MKKLYFLLNRHQVDSNFLCFLKWMDVLFYKYQLRICAIIELSGALGLVH